jgi:hypothetical protein
LSWRKGGEGSENMFPSGLKEKRNKTRRERMEERGMKL